MYLLVICVQVFTSQRLDLNISMHKENELFAMLNIDPIGHSKYMIRSFRSMVRRQFISLLQILLQSFPPLNFYIPFIRLPQYSTPV